MSDELKNRNGEVKAMYVRSDDDLDKRTQNPRIGRSGDRPGTSRAEGDHRPARDDRKGLSSECGRERGCDRDAECDRRREDSLWCTVFCVSDDDAADKADHGGISGKSSIDPEVSRRQRAEETRTYGENACQALFQSRSDAIVRAWFVQSVTPHFKEALCWMAANRKAHYAVDEAELAKASGTKYHGGVCFLIKKRNGTTVKQQVGQAGAQDYVLALEDIANPYNLGGIVRSCAHFGVEGVAAQDAALLESGAAIRTAEGGAEHIQPITGDSIVDMLDDFRQAGYAVVMTSSAKGRPLFTTTLPEKMVLVLGREREALPETAYSADDLCIAIDGTGKVETLNVSVATGVLLAEWWRQNKT